MNKSWAHRHVPFVSRTNLFRHSPLCCLLVLLLVIVVVVAAVVVVLVARAGPELWYICV